MAQLQESGVLTILQHALEAQPEPHPLVAKFEHLIDKDFVDFSRLESGCDNLKAYIGLQQIKQRLQEIANFPEINSKTVIAVGGGFSAGKSSFINSLLEDTDSAEQVRLATGTRPVTAVPSYLVNSNDQVEICGVNYKNARFTIDASDYEELKHDSARIGSIRVGSAIKYCTVKLKFKPDLLEQCCLIDIPGYNPGTNESPQDEVADDAIDTGAEVDLSFLDDDPDASQSIEELNVSGIEEPSSDYNIAREAIAKADCLIWLFSLEHGPLPANDLEFLKKLGVGRSDKPIYFVGNKADVRTLSDVTACLKQTCQTLANAGIAYAGICAYSSKLGKVTVRRAHSDFDVLAFIRQNNHSKDIAQQIDGTLQAIFSIYFKKIAAEVEFSDRILERLEEVERKGYQEGVFRPGKRLIVQDRLDELKEELYQRRKTPSDLKAARKVKDTLSACVKEFCSSLDVQPDQTANVVHCVGCGCVIEEGTELCPKCHSFQDCSGRKCPHCGTVTAFEASFCPECGFNFNEG